MKKKVVSLLSVLILCVSSCVSAVAVSSNAQALAKWDSFRGSFSNMAVLNVDTATSSDEAFLKWQYSLKESTDWFTNLSDPIIVDGYIYVVVGDSLEKVSLQGQRENSVRLMSEADYTCRPVFAQGKIIIPLSNGKLEAINLATLKTEWTTEEIIILDEGSNKQEQQSMSTLTYSDGCVYFATAYADWVTSYSGTFACVDVLTGEQVWQFTNTQAGYYWSGGVCTDDAIIFGGDDSVLYSLNKKTGEVIDETTVSAAVRSTMTIKGEYIYFTTTNGTLYQIKLTDNSKFSEIKSVKFAASSTSTPVVYGNTVYVGGGLGADDDYCGVLAEIDTDSLTAISTYRTPAEVKSAPLLTSINGSQYVYYTCNTLPGGIYLLNAETKETSQLFIPNKNAQNYCMNSIIADENGTLYYINDSGNMFAVGNNKLKFLGDVTNDNVVDMKDVVALQKHVAEIATLDGDNYKFGDVTGNNLIDMEDVVMVQKAVAEVIVLGTIKL